MLVLFFITGTLLKLCDKETIEGLLNVRLDGYDACSALVGIESVEGFDSTFVVSIVMFLTGSVMLLGPLVMLVQQLNSTGKVHVLRLATTKEQPQLVFSEGEKYHLFLSHIWSTGQDQCANIKRQLQLLLPGIVVFLDVDGTPPPPPPPALLPHHQSPPSTLATTSRQTCRILATWRSTCVRQE